MPHTTSLLAIPPCFYPSLLPTTKTPTTCPSTFSQSLLPTIPPCLYLSLPTTKPSPIPSPSFPLTLLRFTNPPTTPPLPSLVI
ncbi:hypothetical protein E2C01_095839 [Portunus trituberculatus]|uniref:Uncharacterized protein n=1 Tax=Portunus trituberculatus TaxID=210409 RepID=A0A5B7JWE2_PORTR|nr:hypothetical protein [Portunus trituberculatus]